MGRYARRKGKAASCKGYGRRGGKTKTKTKDIDQIKEELANGVSANFEDLYCVSCARYFQSSEVLTKHLTSKTHKQRLKKLKDWPDDDS